MPVTYTKNTVNGVAVYTRNTTTNLAHGEQKTLGNVSIDAKLSNSTDYAATYLWSIRKLDANGTETWEPMIFGLQTAFAATDSVGNFLMSNQLFPDTANKVSLWFKANNTATLWESYSGLPGELPLLGSNATVKVDIAWHDKHNAGLSGSLTRYFRFEFPTVMQSEDPSWTFDIVDETNAITLE